MVSKLKKRKLRVEQLDSHESRQKQNRGTWSTMMPDRQAREPRITQTSPFDTLSATLVTSMSAGWICSHCQQECQAFRAPYHTFFFPSLDSHQISLPLSVLTFLPSSHGLSGTM